MLMNHKIDAEALQIYFDPAQVSYETLIKFFYKIHDPTTLNKQGNDAGTQYRSAIFYHDEEQGAIAKAITELAGKYWWTNKKISTQIVPAGTWYDAEQVRYCAMEQFVMQTIADDFDVVVSSKISDQ